MAFRALSERGPLFSFKIFSYISLSLVGTYIPSPFRLFNLPTSLTIKALSFKKRIMCLSRSSIFLRRPVNFFLGSILFFFLLLQMVGYLDILLGDIERFQFRQFLERVQPKILQKIRSHAV